jgi:hypothetical protein
MDLSERIADLPPKKRALLLRKLREKEDSSASISTATDARIPTLGDAEEAPLSFAQERLWFLQKLEPESAAYNVYGAYRIEGPLDLDVVAACFREIVRRHTILRTTYAQTDDGTAVQRVQPLDAVSTRPCLVDLTGLPPAKRSDRADETITRTIREPFSLRDEEDVFRPFVLRVKPDEHILVFLAHHIASDAWSRQILLKEFSRLYQAFATGNPSPLPPLTLQYRDYAAWQRSERRDVLETQLEYWTRQLAGLPNLHLPTDFDRPDTQSYRGATVSLSLGSRLHAKLQELAQQLDATLYMVMLAGFQTLIHAYSGQQDFGVGTSTAGRTHPDLEDLIGFFVNTLVLRADVDPQDSFRELVDNVRSTTLEAYDHQDVPFERIVEALDPARDLGVSPLFQVMFDLMNVDDQRYRGGETQDVGGLTVEVLPQKTATSKFDLTFTVTPDADGLKVSNEFSADLFSLSTAARMLGHYETLLKHAVGRPEQAVGLIPLLTETERRPIRQLQERAVPASL